MNKQKDLLLEVAEQMETLSMFADQAAWDSLVSRVKAAADIDEPTGHLASDQTQINIVNGRMP